MKNELQFAFTPESGGPLEVLRRGPAAAGGLLLPRAVPGAPCQGPAPASLPGSGGGPLGRLAPCFSARRSAAGVAKPQAPRTQLKAVVFSVRQM